MGKVGTRMGPVSGVLARSGLDFETMSHQGGPRPPLSTPRKGAGGAPTNAIASQGACERRLRTPLGAKGAEVAMRAARAAGTPKVGDR